MDNTITQAKWIFLVIFIATALTVAITFYKYYILQDYLVFQNVTCDPARDSCFIGDGEYTPEYYSVISKKAYLIPECDAWAGECVELTCSPSDGDGCTQEFCEASADVECSEH
ncbi:MAG: hypothetical protein RLZZ283_227 [Candidatus Parcubacteria bacterium]|jgi:hypothetical protein